MAYFLHAFLKIDRTSIFEVRFFYDEVKEGIMMKLIAVTTDTYNISQLGETIVALAPFVDEFVIREKSKTAAELCELFDFILENGVTSEQLVVHERVDLAHAYHIPTVQLPYYSMPLHYATTAFPNIHFRKSVHSLEEALEAERAGAHSVTFGHLFATQSKHTPPRGLEAVKKIKKQLTIPFYVIGGIQIQHIDTLRDIQVDGIAVMSSIFHAPSPVDCAIQFATTIKGETNMKSIQLNGQLYELPKAVTTIEQLIQHLQLEERIFVVEHNEGIVDPEAFNTPILDRDKIEIIHFVGGG